MDCGTDCPETTAEVARTRAMKSIVRIWRTSFLRDTSLKGRKIVSHTKDLHIIRLERGNRSTASVHFVSRESLREAITPRRRIPSACPAFLSQALPSRKALVNHVD